MDREKDDTSTAAPADGGRYPVFSQVQAFPGLFVGMLGAIAATAIGVILAQIVPAVPVTGALVVATPLTGLSLGLGIGWDGEVPPRLAQRLQPVGFALLILPPVVGLTAGQEAYHLTWISVAGLAVALGTVTIGRRLPGGR